MFGLKWPAPKYRVNVEWSLTLKRYHYYGEKKEYGFQIPFWERITTFYESEQDAWDVIDAYVQQRQDEKDLQQKIRSNEKRYE